MPGTAPRRRRARTSRSPGSSSAPPTARWPAAAWRPPPRSSTAPRGSRPTPRRRARRLLAAARAKRDAGALDAALELLVAVEAGPLDAQQAAEVEQLRGEIAFDQRRVGEAARLLASAARRLEPLDAELARTTHFKALGAAMWAGEDALAKRPRPCAPRLPGRTRARSICCSTRSRPASRTATRAAAPRLRQALDAVLALEPAGDVDRWLWLTGVAGRRIAAMELWDDDAWHALAERGVQVAREMGALVRLQFALHSLARTHLLGGDLAAAAQAIEEERAIAAATGTSPVAYTDMTLTAWRGQEALTAELIARERREAAARGIGRRRPPRDLRGGAAVQRPRPLRRRAATRPGARSSTTIWATRRSSCPRWPRRRRAPAMRRC